MEHILWLVLMVAALTFLTTIAGLIWLTKKIGPMGVANEREKTEIMARINSYEQYMREELQRTARENRTEINHVLASLQETLLSNYVHFNTIERNQMDSFSGQINVLLESIQQSMEQMRETLASKIQVMQEENEKKLDQMRAVVEDKLQVSLEQRLSESFKVVSDQLESVYKGLGEMQNLAADVGDLKRVLTNVKTRGTWGEVQLGHILADLLSANQYQQEVAVKKGMERVEYAVKMPGADLDGGEAIWLPIDAKFPLEDYQRLLDAYEKGRKDQADTAAKALESRVKNQAKEIAEKYIEPPYTTDFAIMFLPAESLYAEVLRRPGLFEYVHQHYRVTIAGPTTLTAILSSLAIGFRTLALHKRSNEVWQVLGTVKTEFLKFALTLEKTQKKLQEASSSIEEAARRTRVMERKLKNVERLPEEQMPNRWEE